MSAQSGSFFDNHYKFQIDRKNFLIIKNYDNISVALKDYKYVNFTLKQYYNAFIVFFYQNIETILNMFLILYFCLTKGFIITFLIFHLLFFITMENKMFNLKAWEVNYYIFILFVFVETLISYFFSIETKS